MKSKATKRALLSSVLAMVLCCAMLVGSTFAWFTDSVVAGKNTIVAGNLDVELYALDENDTYAVVDPDESLFNDEALWEPGYTQVVYLKVANEGTLALKYKFAISIADETEGTNVYDDTFKLSNYIKFGVVEGAADEYDTRDAAREAVENTATPISKGYSSEERTLEAKAESGIIALVVYMPEDVGNEANYKTETDAPKIELGVSLVATQYTYEKDSFDEQYDKNAVYPTLVASTEDFDNAIASIGKGSGATNQIVVVNVTEDVQSVTGIVTTDTNSLTVDFGGKTVSVAQPVGSSGTVTSGMQLLKGSTVVLKNGTYKAENGENKVKLLVQNYSDLTLDDVTLDGTASSACSYVLSTNCGEVLITGNTNITANSGGTALDIMHWENTTYKEAGTHVVIDEKMTGTIDGKINVYCYRNNQEVTPVDDEGATLTIKGGTFMNSGLTLNEFKAFVADGYTVTENDNGSYTVAAE